MEWCFSIATSIVFGWSNFFFFGSPLVYLIVALHSWNAECKSHHSLPGVCCWVLLKLPCLPCYCWALRDIKELCLNLNLPCCGFPLKHRTFSCPLVPCSVSCQDMDARSIYALLPLQFLGSLLASLHAFGFFSSIV